MKTMTEEKNIPTAESEEVKETPAEEATETPAPEAENKKEKKNKKTRELEAKIAELEAAGAEKDDKYLRLCAEYDNFRRRSQKERENVYSDAYSDAINALLPVLDNLGRAVGCEDPKALAEGLALILKSFDEGLAKLGIEEIKAVGETFDPERHYAVLHIEDENYGENEVVEVLQKGYTRGDKVIRYAVVKVAN
ncbi:MAG: nucleotide exchange factor GrpE [Clostridia bacterium]|jgi:molecular chaperone GrpE|nr:nucleotide exchange factor GrpE [Clostridia bacterium]